MCWRNRATACKSGCPPRVVSTFHGLALAWRSVAGCLACKGEGCARLGEKNPSRHCLTRSPRLAPSFLFRLWIQPPPPSFLRCGHACPPTASSLLLHAAGSTRPPPSSSPGGWDALFLPPLLIQRPPLRPSQREKACRRRCRRGHLLPPVLLLPHPLTSWRSSATLVRAPHPPRLSWYSVGSVFLSRSATTFLIACSVGS